MRLGLHFLIPLVTACLIFVSCSDDDIGPSGQGETFDSLLASFIEDNNIDLQEGVNGVYFYEISGNNETSALGNVAHFFYDLSVFGGSAIDAYDESDGLALRARQGANAIYPLGLDYALSLMNEGEEYGFLLPPAMAYGETLLPGMQDSSYTHLIVRVETVETPNDVYGDEQSSINDFITNTDLDDTLVHPVDPIERLNSGVVFKRLTKDTTTQQPAPQNGQVVVIDFTAYILSGPGLEDSTNLGSADAFEFVLGAEDILPGLQQGVRQMRLGETAIMIIPSSEAYQESVQIVPNGFPRFGDNNQDQVRLTRFESFYLQANEKEIIPEYALSVPPYSTLMFRTRLSEIR